MAPKTTPIQHWILGLCFKNKEKTGTSTIYNAVIKALLLAVVNTSPTCWNVAPQNRNVPQQIPPSRSSFFCFFCSSCVQTLFVSAGRFCFFFPSSLYVTGKKGEGKGERIRGEIEREKYDFCSRRRSSSTEGILFTFNGEK